MEVSPLSSLSVVAVRLHPDEDVRLALMDLCRRHGWKAVTVVSGIGSLSHARLRFAAEPEAIQVDRPTEILTLTGTLSPDGCHLHALLGDTAGSTLGGHLLSPSPVRTTAELVLGILKNVGFQRRRDSRTGFTELTFPR